MATSATTVGVSNTVSFASTTAVGGMTSTVVTTPVGVTTALVLTVEVSAISPSGVKVGKARMVIVMGRLLVSTAPLASRASRASE